MSILTLIVYLIASMFLGFILKKIEIKKRDNLVDYVIVANIYMIVLSGIFDFYKILNNNDNICLSNEIIKNGYMKCNKKVLVILSK